MTRICWVQNLLNFQQHQVLLCCVKWFHIWKHLKEDPLFGLLASPPPPVHIGSCYCGNWSQDCQGLPERILSCLLMFYVELFVFWLNFPLHHLIPLPPPPLPECCSSLSQHSWRWHTCKHKSRLFLTLLWRANLFTMVATIASVICVMTILTRPKSL